MHSRGNGNNSARVRRAKSTSSIVTPHKLFNKSDSTDAEVARQDALTAASLAFERAHDRAMARIDIEEMKPGRPTTDGSTTGNGDRPVKEQSVRFTGPTAVSSTRGSITRREAPIYNPNPQSHHTDVSNHGIESFMLGLSQGRDYVESEVASIPSSYRKVRKAKSMFSPHRAFSVTFTNGAPEGESPVGRHRKQLSETGDQTRPALDPRLKRSFSFLRGKADHSISTNHQYSGTDAAVLIARDQYLRDFQQQKCREQPSLLGLGRRRKSQKAFRKTVRTSSTNSYGSAIASPTPIAVEPTGNKGFGHRARKISSSLKEKLKRVFQRPLESNEALPVQQLDASRPHFGDYMSTSSGLEQRYQQVPSIDGEILRRANSRESNLRSVPIVLDENSRTGSIRSARSAEDLSDGKSRITSWTNSTAANTIASRDMTERKRLSIIQENGGPHQSSSTRQYGDLDNGYAVFRKPVRNQSSGGRLRGPVDSLRVYSALQRRMAAINYTSRLDENDSSTDGASDHTTLVRSDLTPRSSSVDRQQASPGSFTANDIIQPLDRSRGVKMSKSVIFNPLPKNDGDDVFSPSDDRSAGRGISKDFSDAQMDLTPQQIAERNEATCSHPKRPLRELKSTFFPSAMRFERKNSSPYRRAMQASSEDGSNSEAESTQIDQSGMEEALRDRAVLYRARHGSTAMSESVYSRTSGGHTPKPADSSLMLARSESSGEPGTAVITRKSRKYKYLPVSSAGRNVSSTSSAKSSGDWQKWMASQVANLERHGAGNPQIYDTELVKGNGHKRENAQLDGDDTQLGKLPTTGDIPKQPLAIIHGNAIPRPALKHTASQQMGDRFPLLDIGSTSNTKTTKEQKSTLRNRSATDSHGRSNTENENIPSSRSKPSNNELRAKASYGSIGPERKRSILENRQELDTLSICSEAQGTPTPSSTPGQAQSKLNLKMHSPYSPERLARLRRLQESNSKGSRIMGDRKSESPQIHHKHENQAVQSALRTESAEEDSDAHGELGVIPYPATGDNQIAGGRNMVDCFLGNRRKNMRFSEESGRDPIFL